MCVGGSLGERGVSHVSICTHTCIYKDTYFIQEDDPVRTVLTLYREGPIHAVHLTSSSSDPHASFKIYWRETKKGKAAPNQFPHVQDEPWASYRGPVSLCDRRNRHSLQQIFLLPQLIVVSGPQIALRLRSHFLSMIVIYGNPSPGLSPPIGQNPFSITISGSKRKQRNPLLLISTGSCLFLSHSLIVSVSTSPSHSISLLHFSLALQQSTRTPFLHIPL